MIRVLHICTALNDGGVERCILNYYCAIDREQIQFDYVVHSSEEGILESKVRQLGAKVFHVPPKSRHAFTYYQMMKKIFREGHYDIVHCHQGYKSVYPLSIAKQCGIAVRIAHAHTTGGQATWFQGILKRMEVRKTCKNATVLFSCSDNAGKYMWGNRPFTIIPNAVELQRFRFSESNRKRVRKELKIEQNWVIGCVGRMVPSKNHKRLFGIIRLLQKYDPHVALLLIGSGPLEDNLKELAATQGLKNVTFLGSCEKVEEYLSACDAFVLPTLYEGFGMALLEAQENGLDTITSNVVPKAVKISNRLQMVSLENTDENWVQRIIDGRNKPREEVQFTREAEQYDIHIQAINLTNIYRELSRRKQ